jgi:hypothetical protein
MKKIFAFFILLGIATHVLAQSQFGIFAGPQVTTSKYSINAKKQPTTPKYGFQAGVGFKIPFDVNLYFSPAAFYSLKGYKVQFNQKAFPPDTMALDNNTTIHTFELAFLLQYDLGKEANHCFIKLGPSLDFQLLGKEKFNLKNNTAINRDMTFDFSHYGRYAASALIQFGYESASGLFLFGQYTHGLGSINNADGGPSIRHRVYGISVGKYINRKKLVIDTKNKE